MSSPSVSHYHGHVTGVAADITVATCPFKPRTVRFYVDGGSAIEIGYKSDEMAGDAYLSTSTGTDAGVTLTNTGFVLANGADVNVAGAQVHFEITG